MQLPVVVLKVEGTLYVLEYTAQTNYNKLTQFIENFIPCEQVPSGLDWESLKALYDLASSEADQKLVIKAAASAGLSSVKAKAVLGISNVHELRKDVAHAVEEYYSIRKKVDDIIYAKLKYSEIVFF